MSAPPQYVLSNDEVEIARLEAQATWLAPGTALLLRAAGIAPGMRVLDLGTGLGHVATQVAELVGPEGSVVVSTRIRRWSRRPSSDGAPRVSTTFTSCRATCAPLRRPRRSMRSWAG